jgi:hypothetical protein
VTTEGYGEIEFLDATGKVIEVIAPEARARARPRRPTTEGERE